MDGLIHSFLNRASPRYLNWYGILGSDEVPLESAQSFRTTMGPEKDVPIYKLAIDRFSPEQRERLVAWIVEKFSADPDAVNQELDARGFPIREADVVVSFDMRLFL